MNFEQLVRDRQSAINFDKDFKMQESDFADIINLVKLAPSAYNLQPTQYLVITDQKIKEEIYKISYEQYKIHSASAVVFVLCDKNSFSVEAAKKIYEPMKMLKIMDESQYNDTLQMVGMYADSLKDSSGEELLKKEIHLVSSISAAFFLLSAQSLGFNTCPMHVVDSPRISDLLDIPNNMELVMMITIGKSVEKKRQRGYRKRNGEMLRFNRF